MDREISLNDLKHWNEMKKDIENTIQIHVPQIDYLIEH